MYRDKLGFQVAFSVWEPAFFSQIFRGGARLNLRRVCGRIYDECMRSREPDVVVAGLTLDDAKPSYLEFQAVAVAFHQPLRTEPWGARTFIVRDPDGNLVVFAGRSR